MKVLISNTGFSNHANQSRNFNSRAVQNGENELSVQSVPAFGYIIIYSITISVPDPWFLKQGGHGAK